MQVCSVCGKGKANYQCGLCGDKLCKSCSRFLEPEQLSYLRKVPEDLRHTTYCEPCFDKVVTPALEDYQQKLALAREVQVFEKSQSKESRLIKRDHDPIHIKDCPDYNEAILRMAFTCVEMGCNALIDVDLKSKKVRNAAYQTSIWSGTGRPAHYRQEHEIKDKSFRHNPN